MIKASFNNFTDKPSVCILNPLGRFRFWIFDNMWVFPLLYPPAVEIISQPRSSLIEDKYSDLLLNVISHPNSFNWCIVLNSMLKSYRESISPFPRDMYLFNAKSHLDIPFPFKVKKIGKSGDP